MAARLRQQVRGGSWPHLSRLPPDADLARHLGVGTNTVRRALTLLHTEGLVERRRGSGTVVLGQPSSIEQTGPRVGVLVPSLTRYFPPLVRGVRDVVEAGGGTVVARPSDHGAAQESAVLDDFCSSGLEAMVVVPLTPSLATPQFRDRLESLEVPVVVAERLPPVSGAERGDSRLSCVVSDVRRGGLMAVHHLVRAGRSRIGLLSSRDTATSEDFHSGFTQAAHDLGVAVGQATLRWRYDWRRPQQIRRTVRGYVSTLVQTGTDAVVCFDSTVVSALLRELEAAGCRVPDDVAVITYDEEGGHPTPIPVTAVVPDRGEVGRLAAHVLLRQLDRGIQIPVTQTLVSPDLVLGAST
ncbi:MAG TPA: LacI family DNA-binding transcriptional regulator [Candidatus Avipropionibacterium avicola]|uniref:LacI family DNA-binding transcriptional regulator n=1 Tax=Candidatus Avipropionibacterium avicola TaxID=2840701 RepID=A0A9D1KMM4_9ACTN|nr:LacI family DNA-binding transcriptional regulator [Candidatus Avipropionibacterium avicola]